jgi:hypothetical protein
VTVSASARRAATSSMRACLVRPRPGCRAARRRDAPRRRCGRQAASLRAGRDAVGTRTCCAAGRPAPRRRRPAQARARWKSTPARRRTRGRWHPARPVRRGPPCQRRRHRGRAVTARPPATGRRARTACGCRGRRGGAG